MSAEEIDSQIYTDPSILDEKVDISIETIGAASTEMSSFEISPS